MIAKYCPECGQDNLIYYNERKQHFKCPKCQKWLAIGEYRAWEVEFIERKLDQIDKMAIGKKEVDE